MSDAINRLANIPFAALGHSRRAVAERPLGPGEPCRWNDRRVQVVQLLSNALATVFDEGAGQVVTVPVDQLRPYDAPAVSSIDALPKSGEAWIRAVALCAEFPRFSSFRCLPRVEAKRLATQFERSVRDIVRMRARFAQDPRASALLPREAGRKASSWSLDRRVEAVISHTIAKHYLKRERITVTELIERIQSLCRWLGLPLPSANTVKLRLSHEDPEVIARRRMGAKFAKQRYVARPGGLSVTRPLALCQIDHTLMDVLVVSDDRSQVLGRPWLTVAMCVATRTVLGIHVTLDAPSAVSVALCLAHAASPKEEENRDVPGRWPMFGKPETILVDNGRDFRGLALQQGCDEHGIRLTWRPVATPHYGGHIERLMGTLMTLVKGLPSATSSNSKERGDYEAESKAALTLEETRQWLTVVICDYYHARPHRVLQLPPVVSWERQWTTEDGVLTAPPLMHNLRQFQLDFYPSETRSVQRAGVEFKRSRYWHPRLAQWVGRDAEVIVRYHPRDLSRVFIRTPSGEDIEAPAVAGRAVDGRVASLTPEESARVAERLDRRFVEGDALIANAVSGARKAKRKGSQNRPVKGRGGIGRAKTPASVEETCR